MTKRQSFYVGIKAIISRNDKVLILQDTQKQKWELPGGRIDGTQSFTEALGRELSEEIKGAKLVKLGGVVHATAGDFIVENNHRLCLVFYASEVSLPEVIELSDEHSQSAWVDKESVDDYDMYSSDRAAVDLYLSK